MPNFDLIWSQTSPLTPYEFSDADYQEGWNVVGSTPPARSMFDAIQRNNDLKTQGLNGRLQTVETEIGARGRQKGTAYTVGEFVTSTELPTGYYLQCVVAGNTGTGVLYIPDKTVGALVMDGTVTWKVLSYPFGAYVLTRSTPYSVGNIVFCPALAGGMFLECTTAGTTGTQEPTAAISVAIDGTLIADGTAVWTAHSINNSGSFNMLRRNKAYAVGDIAYSRNLPSYLRLECVSAGTTSGTEPNYTNITAGQYVTDGTVVFIVTDIRDGAEVGDIKLSPVLRKGYVKANGALLTSARANYPRLITFLTENPSLNAANDTAWNSNKALYVYDSSANTLRVPDATGRVLQGGSAAGMLAAGLPNITGTLSGVDVYGKNGVDNPNISGAFSLSSTRYGGIMSANVDEDKLVNFTASRSNSIFGSAATVQPPALTMIPQIKY